MLTSAHKSAHHGAHTRRPPAAPHFGRPWFLGRFHPDRASLKGYLLELRVHVSALRCSNAPRTFVILSRPRSGSTLLQRLLNQVPRVTCEGELLHHAVVAPRLFLRRLAAKSTGDAYGIKVLSYQLSEVQGFRDAVPLVRGLRQDGVEIIHLKRNRFDVALSLALTETTRRYVTPSDVPPLARAPDVDPDLFRRALQWTDAYHDFEAALLRDIQHVCVTYETDLRDAAQHQITVDRICKHLAMAPAPVQADVRPSFEKGPANMTALRDIATEMGIPIPAP